MLPLTHNATIISESAGRRVLDIRGKWVNWLDQDGWKPIDSSFRNVGPRWECRTAPMLLSLPPFAGGLVEMVSANRFDIFTKRDITDPDFTVGVRAEGVAMVPAIPLDSDTISYTGAYPFGDLVYQFRHGRAPRCEKLVKINVKPAGTSDLRISFTLRADRHQAATFDRVLSQRDQDDFDQIAIDRRNRLADNASRVEDIMSEHFRGRAIKTSPWDGQRRVALGAEIGFVAHQAAGRRGIGIKPAFAWDSSPEPRRIPIRLEIEKLPNGDITLTKVLPRAFLETATYPVWTDTTSTFYPDPNTETTSVDGYIGRSATETWATKKAAANGTQVFDSTIDLLSQGQAGGAASPNWTTIRRSIILFDTSAIGSGATVNSATESIYCTEKANTGLNSPKWNVYEATPVSNTSLVTGDYSRVGATAYSTDITYAALTVSAYTDYVLNSTGLAAISLTGITKTSLREAVYDAGPTSPTHTITANMSFQGLSADEIGTSQDPKLVVDYTPAATGGMAPRLSIPKFLSQRKVRI